MLSLQLQRATLIAFVFPIISTTSTQYKASEKGHNATDKIYSDDGCCLSITLSSNISSNITQCAHIHVHAPKSTSSLLCVIYQNVQHYFHFKVVFFFFKVSQILIGHRSFVFGIRQGEVYIDQLKESSKGCCAISNNFFFPFPTCSMTLTLQVSATIYDKTIEHPKLEVDAIWLKTHPGLHYHYHQNPYP